MDQNGPAKITFEEEEWRQSARPASDEMPKFVQWVIVASGGLVKNEKQANYVLIGFVVVAAVIVFVLLFSGGGSKAKFEAPAGYKIIYPKNAPPQLEALP